MPPKIDIITLAVTDRHRAFRFYESALGGAIRAGQSVQLAFGGSSSPLCLQDWDAVARTADVDPQSRGFRAFTLSYIVESADAVDTLLERAEQNGGAVSKPPKNAVWGYSAYVTDPDGYHWKIASSKRRPLIGRKGTSSSGNAPEIKPKEIPITIGVADMRRSKEFYEHGLGLPVKKSYGTKFVMFGGEGDTSDLGMYKREALADDAAVQPDGSGFHGFTLTYVADSAEQVDQLLARVNQAGARILTWPSSASDVYSGHFADFDGNVWQIVSNA